MFLRRVTGPSLETGAVFEAALSGNYGAIAIWCLCWAYKKNVMKKAGGLDFMVDYYCYL